MLKRVLQKNIAIASAPLFRLALRVIKDKEDDTELILTKFFTLYPEFPFNIQGKRKNTLLHYAAACENLEAVKFLTKRKNPSLILENCKKLIPLECAALAFNHAIFVYLFDKTQQQLTSKQFDKVKAKILQRLLMRNYKSPENEKNAKAIIDIVSKEAIHLPDFESAAIRFDRKKLHEWIQRLKNNLATDAYQKLINCCLLSFLFQKARANNLRTINKVKSIAKLLIKEGGDINFIKEDGNNILHLMVSKFQISINFLNLLVKLGANFNQQNHYGKHVLHIVAELHNIEYIANWVAFLQESNNLRPLIQQDNKGQRPIEMILSKIITKKPELINLFIDFIHQDTKTIYKAFDHSYSPTLFNHQPIKPIMILKSKITKTRGMLI